MDDVVGGHGSRSTRVGMTGVGSFHLRHAWPLPWPWTGERPRIRAAAASGASCAAPETGAGSDPRDKPEDDGEGWVPAVQAPHARSRRVLVPAVGAPARFSRGRRFSDRAPATPP